MSGLLTEGAGGGMWGGDVVFVCSMQPIQGRKV